MPQPGQVHVLPCARAAESLTDLGGQQAESPAVVTLAVAAMDVPSDQLYADPTGALAGFGVSAAKEDVVTPVAGLPGALSGLWPLPRGAAAGTPRAGDSKPGTRVQVLLPMVLNAVSDDLGHDLPVPFKVTLRRRCQAGVSQPLAVLTRSRPFRLRWLVPRCSTHGPCPFLAGRLLWCTEFESGHAGAS
jgi:hypothetical protein